jgi:hypothetical protein
LTTGVKKARQDAADASKQKKKSLLLHAQVTVISPPRRIFRILPFYNR